MTNLCYSETEKALYGRLQAALLFWRLLSDTLKEWGFKLSKYYQCVANKNLNGQQCTIIWHVDDLRWWVDSSYAVHPDMQSHSSITMTLSKWTSYTASCKQKLNTKSSTEGELVAIDNYMAQVLWTRHLLAVQGMCMCMPTMTIYQDNNSTILLAENGKTSSSR